MAFNSQRQNHMISPIFVTSLVRVFVTLTVATAPSLLFAQVTIESQTPSYSTTLINNEFQYEIGTSENQVGFKLIFKDGREIEVLSQVTDYIFAPLKMNLTETLCSKEQKIATCTLVLPLAIRDSKTIWTKHPDINKIGKEVSYTIRFEGRKEKRKLFDSTALQFISIEKQQRMKNELTDPPQGKFICDSYHWTGQDIESNHGLPQLLFSNWSGESNSETIETGVSENQTSNGAFQVLLKPTFGQIFQIERAQFYSSFSGTPALVTNGPVAIVQKNNSNELCQSTFNMSFGKATQIINELRSEVKNRPLQKTKFSNQILDGLIQELKRIQNYMSNQILEGFE